MIPLQRLLDWLPFCIKVMEYIRMDGQYSELPYKSRHQSLKLEIDLACSEVLAPEDNVGHGPRYLPCLDVFLSDLHTCPVTLFVEQAALGVTANNVQNLCETSSRRDGDRCKAL